MKTIFLVRHCKAAGQAPEARLTDEGQKQAEQLVYFFKDEDIEAIYSSPFVRALDLNPYQSQLIEELSPMRD